MKWDISMGGALHGVLVASSDNAVIMIEGITVVVTMSLLLYC